MKIGRFFSSPSKIFSQEKKSKNPKKICDKKNENFFFCFCFSVFSPLFFSYYKKIFLYFFPLFHFWNVCVISSCFNRTWLEFVSIRLEQFFRVIKKILKGKKRRQKHFSSLCQYPPWKKNCIPLVCCCISKLLHECVKKTFFCHLKKTKRVQEKNANKKILDLKNLIIVYHLHLRHIWWSSGGCSFALLILEWNKSSME